jgi:hypothetical protein
MCIDDKSSSVGRLPGHWWDRKICYLHIKFQTSIQIIKQPVNISIEQQTITCPIDIGTSHHFHGFSVAQKERQGMPSVLFLLFLSPASTKVV